MRESASEIPIQSGTFSPARLSPNKEARPTIDKMLLSGGDESSAPLGDLKDPFSDFGTPQRDPAQVMDNPRLAVRSEEFVDDSGVKVIKRCFLLAIGEDDTTSNAFQVVLSFNINDEPQKRKKIEIRGTLSNIIVETCPEILKSVTQLVPEFKALFRFKDLHPYRAGLRRKLELLAPLYFLRENVFRQAKMANAVGVQLLIRAGKEERAKRVTEAQRKKIETNSDKKMIKTLKGADAALRDLDFDIFFEVQKIGINVTGNQNFYELANQRLVEVGLMG